MHKTKTLVGTSQIHERGLFAIEPIEPGTVVVHWEKQKLGAGEYEKLTTEEKKFVDIQDGETYLMGEPARYINHSCSANTVPGSDCDISLTHIKFGEEITTDYALFFIPGGRFQCLCSSPNCRGIIFGKNA